MENLFSKVDTVFVTVENMEKSIEWYRDCLGLQQVWKDNFITVMSSDGETYITLMQKSDEEYPLFNFLTPDIEKAHQHLTEMGVEVEPIRDEEVLKTFDFKDPDGNRLNVCWLKERD